MADRAHRWIMLHGSKYPVPEPVAPQREPADFGLLEAVSERTKDEQQWRVENLLPAGGRLLLVAANKTGKTTLSLQLARSLLDGSEYLGAFNTEPVAGRVAILNYEVNGATMARWCRELGLPGDRVLLINMRGAHNLLANDEGREELVDILRSHDSSVCIVDPFAVAYTGRDADDSNEVRPWLSALDQLVTRAGCTELVLVNHTGHNQERSRNSSALLDWADSVVTVTRDSEERRYLRAEGRDVSVPEDRLDYDAATRTHRLSGGGSRQKVRTEGNVAALAQAVVAAVTTSPGVNVSGIESMLRASGHGLQRGDAGRAAVHATKLGLIRREAGKGNSVHHYPVVPSSPEPSRREVGSSPEPPLGGGTTTPTAMAVVGAA